MADKIKVVGGKPEFVLSQAEKKMVGMAVVYRITEYGYPKLGYLAKRNAWPDWKIGAWIVRDDMDGRLYVLDNGKWRFAEQHDVEHYQERNKDRTRQYKAAEDAGLPLFSSPDTSVARVGASRTTRKFTGAGKRSASTVSSVPKKKDPASIGDAAAAEIEKEVGK